MNKLMVKGHIISFKPKEGIYEIIAKDSSEGLFGAPEEVVVKFPPQAVQHIEKKFGAFGNVREVTIILH